MATAASADFATSGILGVDLATAHTSTNIAPAPHRTGTTAQLTGNRVAVYAVMDVAFSCSSTVTASVSIHTSTDGTVHVGAGGTHVMLAQGQALTTGMYAWVAGTAPFV